MNTIVYVAKHKITGSTYVGVTSQPLKKRLAVHWATERSPLFKGKDSFLVNEVYCGELRECLIIEDALIEYYDCLWPSGLNKMTSGVNKHHNNQTKLKYRAQRTGIKNPAFGRRGKLNPLSKEVVCIDTGAIFGSAQEAARYLGAHPKAVSRSINNNWRVRGHRFQYTERRRI